MKLGSRDVEIMRVSYEHQINGLRQVSEYFFEGNLGNASRRLSELTAGGYLKSVKLPDDRSIRVFRVSAMGQTVARQVSVFEVPQKRKASVSTLNHDLKVIDVRLRLAQLWDGAWLPEKTLKASEYPQIPDGLVLFKSGRKVAIELENSAKGKDRYLDLWQGWIGTETFLVLYVAATPQIYALLRRHLTLAPKDVAFGLVELQQLRAGTPLVWTPKGEVDLFSRREF